MLENDLKFLEETFKQYYFDHFDLIHVPDRSKEREYGYKKFNSGMIRHISLKTDKDLHLMLMTNLPSDVFCSNGYYSFPNLPMTEKDWKEADLIFDIDAKDLNLSCRKDHTCMKCVSCTEISLVQDTCPKCKSNKLDYVSLPCQNCISGVKKEALNLMKILTSDLQIDDKNIRLSFSGNEGFHVYVTNSSYNQLGSNERRDLIDYIKFQSAMPERFGFPKTILQELHFQILAILVGLVVWQRSFLVPSLKDQRPLRRSSLMARLLISKNLRKWEKIQLESR